MSLFSWFKSPKVNSASTSKKTIIAQMNEPRPLPMGMTEFHEWANRIISGALVPCENPESLKRALSAMLMALGPTEDHKPDAYFIHALRKAAINEVASTVFQEIQLKQKTEAEIKAQERAKEEAKTRALAIAKEAEEKQAIKHAEELDKSISQQAARVSNLNTNRS